MAGIFLACAGCAAQADITVHDNPEQIDIFTSAISASIRKTGYVSGVAGGLPVDWHTGS